MRIQIYCLFPFLQSVKNSAGCVFEGHGVRAAFIVSQGDGPFMGGGGSGDPVPFSFRMDSLPGTGVPSRCFLQAVPQVPRPLRI